MSMVKLEKNVENILREWHTERVSNSLKHIKESSRVYETKACDIHFRENSSRYLYIISSCFTLIPLTQNYISIKQF